MIEPSRRIMNFFCWMLPLGLLSIYGIVFSVFGEGLIYKLDISFSTYERLRLVFGIIPPGIFLLWSIVGICVVERKRFFISSLVFTAIVVIVVGMCYQTPQISRAKFREHDCREALKQYFRNGENPRCPGSLQADSYLFFGKSKAEIPYPIAMDLPKNHERLCHVLYSDGAIVRLVLPGARQSCESILAELNRQYPLPEAEYIRLQNIAKACER